MTRLRPLLAFGAGAGGPPPQALVRGAGIIELVHLATLVHDDVLDGADTRHGSATPNHLVLQSTVFSSILDPGAQAQLAATMWRWLFPGGAVLWYDFTVDNPRNPDVRGVPLARVRALFPQACIASKRVTLAPPLARTRRHRSAPW